MQRKRERERELLCERERVTVLVREINESEFESRGR